MPEEVLHKPNKYLFQCGENILQPTILKYNKLGTTADFEIGKDSFEEYGTEDISYILGDIDKTITIEPTKELGDKDIYEIEIGGYKSIEKVDLVR